ncbi:hypothetical protein [Lichenicoccus sp.]|uniref:hypothetical protein n=1 Tax=Lichenicoccus sp. TaxID=2781899 RepID=UPI003D0F37E3
MAQPAPDAGKEYDHETKPGQEENKRRRTASHGGFPTTPPETASDEPGSADIDGARERLTPRTE